MSSIERRGRWVVPPNFEVSTVMGSVKLDLREAVFVEPKVQITVNTLMGCATIVLPEDVKVDVDGVGFMGTFNGTAGQTIEDMELILSPCVEEAKEAIGSMGDDTPLAVISDKPRPCSLLPSVRPSR